MDSESLSWDILASGERNSAWDVDLYEPHNLWQIPPMLAVCKTTTSKMSRLRKQSSNNMFPTCFAYITVGVSSRQSSLGKVKSNLSVEIDTSDSTVLTYSSSNATWTYILKPSISFQLNPDAHRLRSNVVMCQACCYLQGVFTADSREEKKKPLKILTYLDLFT